MEITIIVTLSILLFILVIMMISLAMMSGRITRLEEDSEMEKWFENSEYNDLDDECLDGFDKSECYNKMGKFVSNK